MLQVLPSKPILQIEPWIDQAEMEQLKRVIDSTFLTESKLTQEFEQLLSTYTGAKHVIAVANGSMALYASLLALGIGPGDEVIVPNFTFVASCNAILLTGAKPVFCEVDPHTFCIDPACIEPLITVNTKAIMPVHLYGQSADMSALSRLAQAHGLRLIEDAAQGIGVQFEGQHVGLQSDLATISFYGNKTITCGEGGIVMTQDKALADKVYRLKNHGRSKRGTFIHEEIGYNFSITEMQAAIGIAQMHKLPAIIERKQQIYDRYLTELSDLPDFEAVYIDPRCRPVFWFTSYLSPRRAELEAYLQQQQIQTRKFFCPLHMQPCYQGMIDRSLSFPVSEYIYERGISLPSAYSLTDEQQDYVIDCIRHFFEK
jgi:perosamine synthetase